MKTRAVASLVCATLTLALLFTLAPTQPGRAAAAPQETIPLFIAINNFGEISLTSGIMEVPRFVVALSAPLPTDVLNLIGQHLLIVRFDGKDHVYNLQGNAVHSIRFDRGYYYITHLGASGDRVYIDAWRTFVMNEKPIEQLSNDTQITTITGRRSCFETAFRSKMWGVVFHPVRLRKEPYIPKCLDLNWKGSLRQNERVWVKSIYCNDGVWLKVERLSGRIGWAKEWGLSEQLIETTFIVPGGEIP